MYQVDDKPETIHLYVVREGPARPSFAPIVLSLFTLALLIILGIVAPYTQPVTRVSLRVPAVPLFVRSFSVSVAIVPTGIRSYPATTAHGILTIKNGSVIGQSIPKDFAVGGAVTESAVYVPPGSADGYGYATVLAHALMSGQQGNLPPFAVNQVIGSSVYVRNLTAFQGGHDGYSVHFVTEQDRHAALTKAREQLAIVSSGLHYPCSEQVTGAVTITWRCQFLTYHLPAYMRVITVHVVGKNLVIEAAFTPHPRRIWVK